MHQLPLPVQRGTENCTYGFEEVEASRGSPRPRSQSTPLLGCSRLAAVGQPDVAASEACAGRLRWLSIRIGATSKRIGTPAT